jgi:hypothetical protein
MYLGEWPTFLPELLHSLANGGQHQWLGVDQATWRTEMWCIFMAEVTLENMLHILQTLSVEHRVDEALSVEHSG